MSIYLSTGIELRDVFNDQITKYRYTMRTTTDSILRDWLSERLPSPAVILSVVLVLGAWQLLSMTMASYRFPGFLQLAESIWLIFTGGTDHSWVTNYGVTLVRIFIGFAVVMVLGSVVGILMGISTVLEDYISTFTVLMLTIPSVLWAFLAVMWFGPTDYLVPVFVIVAIIFPYVTVNMWQGAKDVDSNLIEMATAFKLGRYDMWRHVYIPHLTPYTFSTMRLAFAISWKLSLVAEIFGSSNGIGVVVDNYYQTFQTDMIIAWSLPMMVLMLVVERIFERLEQRSYRWRTDTDTIELEGEAV